MNTIASNLANAETSKTEQGTPYRRKVVSFKSRTARMFSTVMRQSGIRLSTTNGGHMGGEGLAETTGQTVPAGIDVTESEDPSPPRTAFDPGNPDADANGYVRMPNVNVVTGMVNMIATSRSFEANTTAVNAAKSMAKDSLEI